MLGLDVILSYENQRYVSNEQACDKLLGIKYDKKCKFC
jgi:hypothetical protein